MRKVLWKHFKLLKIFQKAKGHTVPLGLKLWYFCISILLNDTQIVNYKIIIDEEFF